MGVLILYINPQNIFSKRFTSIDLCYREVIKSLSIYPYVLMSNLQIWNFEIILNLNSCWVIN